MLVFNLTDAPLTYKGKSLPPNGGSADFPDLSFIPDRDRKLEAKKVLAFGSLPKWFVAEQHLRATPPANRSAKATLASVEPPPSAEDEATGEPKIGLKELSHKKNR